MDRREEVINSYIDAVRCILYAKAENSDNIKSYKEAYDKSYKAELERYREFRFKSDSKAIEDCRELAIKKQSDKVKETVKSLVENLNDGNYVEVLKQTGIPYNTFYGFCRRKKIEVDSSDNLYIKAHKIAAFMINKELREVCKANGVNHSKCEEFAVKNLITNFNAETIVSLYTESTRSKEALRRMEIKLKKDSEAFLSVQVRKETRLIDDKAKIAYEAEQELIKTLGRKEANVIRVEIRRKILEEIKSAF